jgi:hypothetical protein
LKLGTDSEAIDSVKTGMGFDSGRRDVKERSGRQVFNEREENGKA